MNRRFEAVLQLPVFGIALLVASCALKSAGADLETARKQFLSGDYTAVVASAEKALKDLPDDEDWNWLLIKSLLETGQYPEANRATTNALAQEPRSLRLRWLAREVFQSNGQSEAAAECVERIIRTVSSRPSAYRDAP